MTESLIGSITTSNWFTELDSPSLERLEDRCRTTRDTVKARAFGATGKAGSLAFTGLRLVRPFGFHALAALASEALH